MSTQIELFRSVAQAISKSRTQKVPLKDVRDSIRSAWSKLGVNANKSTIGDAISGTCVGEFSQACFTGSYYHFTDNPNCSACLIYNSQDKSCGAKPYTDKVFNRWMSENPIKHSGQ